MSTATASGLRRFVNLYGLLLNLVIIVVAGLMYICKAATLLEAISFISGAVCVWLTVKESVWNFPVSLLNVVTFAIVYFHARLFADATLQAVYFVLTVWGWYWWMYGGEAKTKLHISYASTRELLLVLLAGASMTYTIWNLLHLVGGSATFWDAITTSISLCAQWLLNRKKYESWYFWILADLIYVPLYIYKQLYLTSILYSVFIIMCLIGLMQWHRSLIRQKVLA